MKITVLGGGLSPERDVSLKSASLIANALLSKGHEVALVDLYDGIESSAPCETFFRRGTVNPFSYEIPEKEPDLEEIIRQHGGRIAILLHVCTSSALRTKPDGEF